MSDFLQVVSTTDKREEAEHLAHILVEEKLAACVQILGPMTSVYRWQGSVERAEEWLCLCKTTRACYPALEEKLRALHSYETPEIIALPITEGSRGYLEWLESCTNSQ